LSIANGPEAGPEAAAPRAAVQRRPRTLRARSFGLLRWLHIYTSMISLLVVLFFALTGITLNHPDWVFGGAERQQTLKGTLPAGWKTGDQINWLTVAETLRAGNGLHGVAGDQQADARQATLSFRAPGYSADAQIDVQTGAYTLNVDEQGALAVLNDFHRGRDAGTGWAWVIDLSGGFLALIALTGLGLLLFLKKIRLVALATMLGGATLVIVLMRLAA
jgi:uncharacterized protein